MNRERIEELALTYATEGLRGDELAEFEAWRPGASAEELSWFAAIVDWAGEIALEGLVAEEPSGEVKASLLGKLGIGDGADGLDDFEFLTPGGGEWEALPVKGARIRKLSDHEEDSHTIFLLELDAETRFPAHSHKGAESAYVLTGDLEIEGRFLRAGDFSRAAPGSKHRSLYSRDGCQALLVTSRDNFPRKSISAYTGLRKFVQKLAGKGE